VPPLCTFFWLLVRGCAILGADSCVCVCVVAGFTLRQVHRGIAAGDPGIVALVNDLLTALFELTRRSVDEAIWMSVARCLGELGAIDPARVSVAIRVEQVCFSPPSPPHTTQPRLR
jgi:hypothetical protein